ncbi:hypothetical protein C7974DRAFT_439401 [Boeremia exigua]|uniref:uncharacterized protein n=1 Tax=Boeremia exigua TaxID=749465 RepID=UPI001E8DCBB2|nr:uncharacterized protein C7974DRAFT_439401 [Boeremia exigua]KAH6644137.1 hypothetical protein C7974DRAFT_439401 [Boeremia exigua]
MASSPTLLSLPPEIRNRIYEFALTPDRGALYHVYNQASSGKKSFFFEPSSPEPVDFSPALDAQAEFNQLKYVNRQLYSETAAVELEYCRNLFFDYKVSRERAQGAQVVSFLKSVSPTIRARLCTICIRDFDDASPVNRQFHDSATTMSNLDYFCCQHPNLSIRYEITGWVIRSTGMGYLEGFLDGLYWSSTLRNETFSNTPFSARIVAIAMFLGRDISGTYTISARTPREWKVELKAKNLRFFPVAIGSDGKRLSTLPKVWRPVIPWARHETEAIHAQMEQWYNVGL